MDRRVLNFFSQHSREYMELVDKTVRSLYNSFPNCRIFAEAWNDPEDGDMGWENDNLMFFLEVSGTEEEMKAMDVWYAWFVEEIYSKNPLLDLNVNLFFC